MIFAKNNSLTCFWKHMHFYFTVLRKHLIFFPNFSSIVYFTADGQLVFPVMLLKLEKWKDSDVGMNLACESSCALLQDI